MNNGMNNNIDGVLHPNNGIEKKEQPAPMQVWFLDDEVELLDSICENLEDAPGMQFSKFGSPNNFLETLLSRKSSPDIAVIDGNLRDIRLDGPGVMREIKRICQEQNIDLPAIFSFTTDSRMIERMYEEGAIRNLDKTHSLEVCELLCDREKLEEEIRRFKIKQQK